MINHKPTIGLINIVLDGDYQYEQELPLGMAAIGAFLREKGYQVTFKQCFASRGEEEIKAVAGLNFDVYGIQLNITNYHFVRQYVTQLKERKPDAVVVLGGPFLTSLSETILKKEPLFDYIVVGEGELTILEFLETFRQKGDFSSVKGLIWRDSSGEIRKNEYRDLIEDLDTLPFPARDFLEEALRDPQDHGVLESIRLCTSRGCVAHCSFCCVNAYNKVQKGKVWRGRSSKHVVDEIEHLTKVYGTRLYNFADSSFEDPGKLGKERARQICEEIIRRKIPFSAKVYMRCETMKTEEDVDLLRLYKKAGIDVIIIGAEAASDYELKLYEKLASVEDNYHTAKLLKDLDLFYYFTGMIMFGPDSTFETLRNNVEFLHRSGFTNTVNQLSNVLILFRDSKIYHVLKEQGRVTEPENFWELPKYTMKDKKVEKAARYWQNIFNKCPQSFQLISRVVEVGNLISRVTNPMNQAIFEALHPDFIELKKKERQLSFEVAELNYRHFLRILELAEAESGPEAMELEGRELFDRKYPGYIQAFDELYHGFISKVQSQGFGLSGLVFKHFSAAIALGDTKRV